MSGNRSRLGKLSLGSYVRIFADVRDSLSSQVYLIDNGISDTVNSDVLDLEMLVENATRTNTRLLVKLQIVDNVFREFK